MNLPQLKDAELAGKRVLLRADLDVDIGNKDDNYRLNSLVPTIRLLAEKKAITIIIGHKGRPEGKASGELSLEPVCKALSRLSGVTIDFIFDILGEETKTKTQNLENGAFVMLENLRFDSREETNDDTFVKELSSLAEIYVNEAFSASHREHASIVGIPKEIPHYVGLRFSEEIENLSKLLISPQKPVVSILGGFKEDKLKYVDGLKEFSDKVLIGGRLPDYLGDLGSIRSILSTEKVVTGNLIMDKEDLSIHTIERFEEEIKKAKTILLAGPMGKFEEEGHRQGTDRVYRAITESDGLKIAGGGDTIKAFEVLGLTDKFDYISVGGGAMLEYLTKKTLPGIEALLN